VLLTTVRRILALPLLVLAAGLIGATLIRTAPGFNVDEQELDSRLSETSRKSIREERSRNNNILKYYRDYLTGALRGDLGESRSLGRPVTDLMRERFPVTARLAGWGLFLAWLVGLPLALLAAVKPDSSADLLANAATGLLLSVPAAVIAVVFLHSNSWLPLATGLILLPRIFSYLRNTFAKVVQMPHVLAARARGAGSARILWRHVLPVAMPELLALGGVSVSLALSASVPVEVLCDQPGIGQLAWQAALARDLPVLVGLTWVAAAITLLANTLSTSGRVARTGEA
jgi:peptide/nickel transport system permease protein